MYSRGLVLNVEKKNVAKKTGRCRRVDIYSRKRKRQMLNEKNRKRKMSKMEKQKIDFSGAFIYFLTFIGSL
jgi:hypothetical protein